MKRMRMRMRMRARNESRPADPASRVRGRFGESRAVREAYQARQDFSARTMGEPAGHAKAFANSGMFETTPFTR